MIKKMWVWEKRPYLLAMQVQVFIGKMVWCLEFKKKYSQQWQNTIHGPAYYAVWLFIVQ